MQSYVSPKVSGIDRTLDRSTARRRRSQGGNLILESVFTLIPTLVMVFMVLDISFVVFIKGIFQNACREGVRWAITYNTTYNGNSCANQTTCIVQIVQDNSLGFLRGSNSSYIHVNFYDPNGAGGLTTPVTSATPPAYINQTNNVIEVTISGYPLNWMIPIATGPGAGSGSWSLSNNSFTLSAVAADVLQGYPVGQSTPPPA